VQSGAESRFASGILLLQREVRQGVVGVG
jgi:hypothetical protein